MVLCGKMWPSVDLMCLFCLPGIGENMFQLTSSSSYSRKKSRLLIVFIRGVILIGDTVVKNVLTAQGQWLGRHRSLVKTVQVVATTAVWKHRIIHCQASEDAQTAVYSLRWGSKNCKPHQITCSECLSFVDPPQWDGCSLPAAAASLWGLMTVNGVRSSPACVICVTNRFITCGEHGGHELGCRVSLYLSDIFWLVKMPIFIKKQKNGNYINGVELF